MFFVNKPPTYIRFEDVEMIEFKRMDLERRFDLQVTLSSGHNLLFSNIDRPEFDSIYSFLQEKRLPMSSIKDSLKRQRTTQDEDLGQALDDEEEEEEEDEEEEDEDFDPNKKEDDESDHQDGESPEEELPESEEEDEEAADEED
jgi:structure-specific recognition protein 1